METARFVTSDGKIRSGVRDLVKVPTPQAGADWNVVVPGGEQWRILTGRFVFTASAVVASRFPNVQLSNGIDIFWETGPTTGIATGVTSRISIARNSVQQLSGGNQVANLYYLPDVWMPPGTVIQSSTRSMDVGDQYSNIVLFVEHLYETNPQVSMRAEERRQERAAEETALLALGTR